MSTIQSQLYRAMSPNAIGMTEGLAVGEHSSDAASLVARSFVLDGASSFEDLVGTIPFDYRQILRPHFAEVFKLADKQSASSKSLEKLVGHKAKGTLPPYLKSKVPPVQYSKEFIGGDSDSFKQHQEKLLELAATYEKALLDNAIAGKRDELKFLNAALAFDKICKDLTPLIMNRWAEVRLRSQVSKFADAAEGDDGEIVLNGFETSPAKKLELRHLLQTIPTYISRIMSIIEMRDRALDHKIEKKKALVKDADIEMAQVATPGPSMQSLIDKAVNAKISALEKKLSKDKGKGKPNSNKEDLKNPPKYIPKPSSKQPKRSSPGKKSKKDKAGEAKKKSQKGKGKGKGKKQ